MDLNLIYRAVAAGEIEAGVLLLAVDGAVQAAHVIGGNRSFQPPQRLANLRVLEYNARAHQRDRVVRAFLDKLGRL